MCYAPLSEEHATMALRDSTVSCVERLYSLAEQEATSLERLYSLAEQEATSLP
eukprot:COSAG05_NODE_4709_length_1402_cov_1.848810_1_plen_53_part_10